MLFLSFLVSISSGSVATSFSEALTILCTNAEDNSPLHYIIWNYRMPKAITAVMAGSGLALSGLLMQTLFRNPLAGPFVLGISSGASLGAALLIMGGSAFSALFAVNLVTDLSLTLAAGLGSVLVLLLVIIVAARIKDTMALLIIGLMFGSFTAAIVSVLSYFTEAKKLQQFIYWSYGSVGNLTWNQVLLLCALVTFGSILSLFNLKSLNAFLLGENYAKTLGVPLKRTRYGIIIAVGILAGTITAFAGPIAFIGLAVPHVARQLFNTTNHRVLIPAVCCLGAILLLWCDFVAQVPNSATVFPINAITALLGAPIVIWLLVRKKQLIF